MIAFLQVILSYTGKARRQRPTMFIKDLLLRKRIQNFLEKIYCKITNGFQCQPPFDTEQVKMIEQQTPGCLKTTENADNWLHNTRVKLKFQSRNCKQVLLQLKLPPYNRYFILNLHKTGLYQ